MTTPAPTLTPMFATPFASVPIVHTPVPETYVPWLGVADTNVSPDGSKSVTWTFVAWLGPLSVTLTV